jgi:hypothetical protein
MAAAGQDVARTLGHQCMGFLDSLKDFLCGGGETKRTQLAMLGAYPNENGLSAGFFRSGFSDPFVDKNVALQEGGKVHSIVLSYLQRALPSSVTQAATDLDSTQDCTPCTAGTVQEYNEVLIDASSLNTFCRKVTFQNSQWIERCENPEVGMMRRFQAQIDAILNTADVFLIEQAIAQAGANNNHVTLAAGTVPDETLIAEYQQLDIVDANRLPIWATVDQLFEDLDVNELNDCPSAILFSQKGGFATYSRAEAFSCCNDAGANLSAVADALGFAPFKSRNVETAFFNSLQVDDQGSAPDAALILHPGTVHLLEIWKYEHHPFAHGQSMGMVYTDPQSGEKFDMKVYFDDCNEITTFTLSKHVGVFVAPTDQYATGDALESVNGVMLYEFSRA